jgi:transcriptional regulator with XRE-family HTH domain
MALNEGIKHFREKNTDLKQVEAAERLNISKNSLSQYENGKRALPIDVLKNMVALYEISPKDLYAMITDSSYSNQQTTESMVLREKFEDNELERANRMLQDYPQLKRLISTASYYDQKKQKRHFNKLINIFKNLQD